MATWRWCQITRLRVENQRGGFIGSPALVLFRALMSAEVSWSWPAEALRYSSPQKLQTSLIWWPPRTTPSPPVLQPLSKCHLANKTPVHTEPEQNTASSIHTVKRSQRALPPSQKLCCLISFFYLRGRELLTPDQRGYHSKHGRDPSPDIHPVCVWECVWSVHAGHEQAHCGGASVPI